MEKHFDIEFSKMNNKDIVNITVKELKDYNDKLIFRMLYLVIFSWAMFICALWIIL